MSRSDTGFREGTPEEIQGRKDAVCQAALQFEKWLWENAEVIPGEMLDQTQDLLLALSALYKCVGLEVGGECLDS